MNILIDLSTPGSGGAQRHIIELLNAADPKTHGFNSITIFSVSGILNALPQREWLIKQSHPLLNSNWIARMIWRIALKKRLLNSPNSIVFAPVGSFFSNKIKYVSMCRNMLIFDKNEKSKYFIFSFMYIRLFLMEWSQIRSFKHASGVIFLSEYANSYVSKMLQLNPLKCSIINHGVSNNFRTIPRFQKDISNYTESNPFLILYVSSVWSYKHHDKVVDAFSLLLEKGYPLKLLIVGKDDEKKASHNLIEKISKISKRNTIEWLKNVSLNEVISHYKKADLFLYASSCENMPNILIEAMSSGLPIACSQSDPMPEFLGNSGLYFNPMDHISIAESIEKLLNDTHLRSGLADSAYQKSQGYSWKKCADETFVFLKKIYES